MNEHERFERELQRLAPAALPETLRARLAALLPRSTPARPSQCDGVPVWLRWLFPLTATAMGAGLLALQLAAPRPADFAADIHITADEVQFGQTLVSSFDTIARLPDGLPVRFRCEHWVDELVLRDSTRGISVEQSCPRLEVFPVSLETY